MNKDTILYFEDLFGICEGAVKDLTKAFPEYKVIGDEGHEGCVGKVIKKIGGIEMIAIVCTDGALFGNVKGWDIVKELQSRGYSGPAIYTGSSDLPENEKKLYVDRSDQKTGKSLVDSVRKNLKV